jgi:hypothetical protein
MLKACIESLNKSFTVEASIKVVLNQGDKESAEYLSDSGIEFVRLNENYGTLAVDFAIPLFDAEYVVNTNDDMLFHPGWDSDLIGIIERNHPCSASCSLIEPVGTGNYVVKVDDLGDVENPETYQKFIDNWSQGKYKREHKKSSYTHPIMVKTSDWMKVGGYSSNFDMNFFPGYSLDDSFPYRLWKLYGGAFKHIASNESVVYHGISRTNNKLSPEVKARSGWDYFIKQTGMNIHQFRVMIQCGKDFIEGQDIR